MDTTALRAALIHFSEHPFQQSAEERYHHLQELYDGDLFLPLFELLLDSTLEQWIHSECIRILCRIDPLRAVRVITPWLDSFVGRFQVCYNFFLYSSFARSPRTPEEQQMMASLTPHCIYLFQTDFLGYRENILKYLAAYGDQRSTLCFLDQHHANFEAFEGGRVSAVQEETFPTFLARMHKDNI